MTDHIPRALPTCTCGKPAWVHRPKHTPDAWPVCSCGADAARHRVKHKPDGDPCSCGLDASHHVKRSSGEERKHKQSYQHAFVGIDGEGVGRDPHKYVLLAAVSETGQEWIVENPKGLSTKQCLDFILDLPNPRLFSFSFGYDLCKILEDVDNATIYKLFRPSLRHRKGPKKLRGPKHVSWQGYRFNWLNGKFSIQRGKTRRVIWDVYKFYQSTFVTALERWSVGDAAYIQAMKKRRNTFTLAELPEIRKYCLTECKYLSEMARRLIETHEKVGLKLSTYYGPGSTAGVALKRMGIKELRGEHPMAMRTPIARAFFGGRFEHSVMGPVPRVWGYDISSAYPYHLYQLPCLMCGKWTRIKDERDLQGTTALVHYSYRGRSNQSWAPFPVRDSRGSICYPYRSEGWVWYAEYAAARKHFPNVKFLEAWVYNTDCQCHPFACIAQYYRDRVTLGKDAAGIVLKLAINSIYGKLAQSLGLNPAFQCWIWAGMVTAGTRAQILDLMAMAPSRSDILAIATDGVYSRKRLPTPEPIDTGTYDLKKPLGGWEEKTYPDGMFFVKPGIYFPLGEMSEDEQDYLRARGIGRKSLLNNRGDIQRAYARGDSHIELPGVDRFHGAKTSINGKLRRSKRYGDWTVLPIKLAFECVNRNPDMSLKSTDYMSFPYSKGLLNPEKMQALIDEAIEYEQPK